MGGGESYPLSIRSVTQCGMGTIILARSKCIKSYILFLYRHVHLYNAPFDLKIGVLVLLASVRKW